MGKASIFNLTHVLMEDCTDPDCEIHHPEVGLAEETINMTRLAFYLAGAQAVANGENYKAVVDRVTEGL